MRGRLTAAAVAVLALGGGVVVVQDRLSEGATVGATTQQRQTDVTQRVSRPVAAAGSTGGVAVDETWVVRAARATDISPVAVRAYARATLATPRGCELGWTTLAGIGWVESQHGTIDGRTVDLEGRASRPILGPALDGGDLAAIRATPDSTAMHGDPTWEHAVGPMQFIPSSWRRWARDGDGDGVRDPHDLDDAAAAAAAYLCHDQHDLTTSQGWNAAIFSYNHDNGYVVAVHAAAQRYGLATG